MATNRSKMRRKTSLVTFDEADFAVKRRKAVPHEFVLEALGALAVRTRPMFGCVAVYAATERAGVEKIVLVLRDKPSATADNGVWLATTKEHHESLRREFPNMRSIEVLGKEVTGWQVLPADAADFEESALRACELIARGDARIGKVPGARQKSEGRRQKRRRTETRRQGGAAKKGKRPGSNRRGGRRRAPKK